MIGNSKKARALSLLSGVALSLALNLTVGSIPTRASSYNNTNPAATVCWNGSHPVQILSAYYLRVGGLIWARVDLMYSDYCNTQWTRVKNMSGTAGSAYATETRLVADEYLGLYSCPLSSCLVQSTRFNGDVLPHTGDTGWSHQLDIPSGTTLGSPAARQPPTARAIGWVQIGVNWYSMDQGPEPMWTAFSNNFGNSVPERSDPSRVLSCENNHNGCLSWGQTAAGGPISITAKLDNSLLTNPGPFKMMDDYRNEIIPDWNAAVADSPFVTACVGTCPGANILIELVPTSDPDFGGATGGLTFPDGNAGHLMTHRTIKITNNINVYHYCGSVDDGCTGTDAEWDGRKIPSHEFGHALGLGHCDLNSGVMCGRAPGADGHDDSAGTTYWTPQQMDRWGLRAIYP